MLWDSEKRKGAGQGHGDNEVSLEASGFGGGGRSTWAPSFSSGDNGLVWVLGWRRRLGTLSGGQQGNSCKEQVQHQERKGGETGQTDPCPEPTRPSVDREVDEPTDEARATVIERAGTSPGHASERHNAHT